MSSGSHDSWVVGVAVVGVAIRHVGLEGPLHLLLTHAERVVETKHGRVVTGRLFTPPVAVEEAFAPHFPMLGVKVAERRLKVHELSTFIHVIAETTAVPSATATTSAAIKVASTAICVISKATCRERRSGSSSGGRGVLAVCCQVIHERRESVQPRGMIQPRRRRVAAAAAVRRGRGRIGGSRVEDEQAAAVGCRSSGSRGGGRGRAGLDLGH